MLLGLKLEDRFELTAFEFAEDSIAMIRLREKVSPNLKIDRTSLNHYQRIIFVIFEFREVSIRVISRSAPED